MKASWASLCPLGATSSPTTLGPCGPQPPTRGLPASSSEPCPGCSILCTEPMPLHSLSPAGTADTDGNQISQLLSCWVLIQGFLNLGPTDTGSGG